jgi:UPF0755 protein
MRTALWIAVLVAVLAVGAGWAGWQRYQDFLQRPLDLPAPGRLFELPPGASGNDIVEQLAQAGLTRPGWQWRVLMRLEPRVYRAGEYRLLPGMTPREVLSLLASGKVVQYRLTVVEGWTFRQLTRALALDPVLEQRLAPDGDARAAQLREVFDLEQPEGWFLPETYQFTRGDSDLDLLRRAHEAMKRELERAWASRDTGLPFSTPYELLIMASIIEKETALEEERGEIAGVFVRRLQRRMRLQTDPTVIYGLGESFDGDLRRRDLQTDTPYNTYTRHGLPPTPIAMPGRASLAAAANPSDGDTLYFVADGSGGHTFSETLEEHQAAVRKLIGGNR